VQTGKPQAADIPIEVVALEALDDPVGLVANLCGRDLGESRGSKAPPGAARARSVTALPPSGKSKPSPRARKSASLSET
jgi:hypothetical protein